MGRDDMAKTTLSADQLQECLALGATIGDIRALQQDGFSFEEILAICTSAARREDADKQADADRQAKATKRALRPENEAAPGKSVYSYPEGDLARPRPAFACRTFWVGALMGPDISTAREIELLNAVPAGRYSCSKSDGSRVAVTVRVATDEEGRPTQKEFWFPTKDEHRHNQRSQVAMLEEMLEQAQAVSVG